MIDTQSEALLSLTDAAKLLPARRGGKKVSISCLYRWTISGCKGVVLECVQIGGTRCTSREALARFFERLTNASTVPKPPNVPLTTAQNRRATEAAMKELERLGI